MRDIFVFGSNLAGRHGRGAANHALRHHGARYGQGFGLQGNSYAIPTKDANLKTLPLPMIAGYVERFLQYVESHPDMSFDLTPIGCGLAGFVPAQIAPFFARGTRLKNLNLPPEFASILVKQK